jgi:hypothetical protein
MAISYFRRPRFTKTGASLVFRPTLLSSPAFVFGLRLTHIDQCQRIRIANVHSLTDGVMPPADCNIAVQNNLHRVPQKVGERPKPLPITQT